MAGQEGEPGDGHRRCGVLGDPIAHSLSPALHRAGYAELGLDWAYDAHRVPAGGLATFVDGLGPEWRGLSLTMPLKQEVLPHLAETDRLAALALAARQCLHLHEIGAELASGLEPVANAFVECGDIAVARRDQ